jgi:hypothetical protein
MNSDKVSEKHINQNYHSLTHSIEDFSLNIIHFFLYNLYKMRKLFINLLIQLNNTLAVCLALCTLLPEND